MSAVLWFITNMLYALFIVFVNTQPTNIIGSILCNEQKGNDLTAGTRIAYNFIITTSPSRTVTFNTCDSDTNVDGRMWYWYNDGSWNSKVCDNGDTDGTAGTCTFCGSNAEQWVLVLSPGEYYIEIAPWWVTSGTMILQMDCNTITSSPTSSPTISVPNNWFSNETLQIAYLYHDVCFEFRENAANDICINTHGGDGVASIPTIDHWNFMKSVIDTVPVGNCSHFSSGYSYIGVGASVIQNNCSSIQKKDAYSYWNGDIYSNIFEWVPGRPDKDCSSQTALHFPYELFQMDDASFGMEYAVICYKNINITSSLQSTTNVPTTYSPTLSPLPINTTSIPTDVTVATYSTMVSSKETMSNPTINNYNITTSTSLNLTNKPTINPITDQITSHYAESINNNKSNDPNILVIVGVVIGLLVFIIIIICIFVSYLKKRNKHKVNNPDYNKSPYMDNIGSVSSNINRDHQHTQGVILNEINNIEMLKNNNKIETSNGITNDNNIVGNIQHIDIKFTEMGYDDDIIIDEEEQTNKKPNNKYLSSMKTIEGNFNGEGL